MLFNSLAFLVFFPLVTLIYFLLPHRFRWAHLLLASCFFYIAFVPLYLLILAFTIVVDYVGGVADRARGGAVAEDVPARQHRRQRRRAGRLQVLQLRERTT